MARAVAGRHLAVRCHERDSVGIDLLKAPPIGLHPNTVAVGVTQGYVAPHHVVQSGYRLGTVSGAHLFNRIFQLFPTPRLVDRRGRVLASCPTASESPATTFPPARS